MAKLSAKGLIYEGYEEEYRTYNFHSKAIVNALREAFLKI
jgi:hypothetical protein